MGNPEIKSQEKEQNKVWIDVTPSKETKESPKWKEVITTAKNEVEKLKQEIQKDWMSLKLVKNFLDNLDEIDEKNKPFIIWGILSWLNSRWISILWIDWSWKIILKEWKQDFRSNLNIANHDEVIWYKNLINNYISDWKISISDINKALTFRTSSIDTYIWEKTQNQKLSTSEYAQRLMEKYKIRISGGTIKDIVIWNEEDLKIFKANINNAITDNQADKEFLFAYFDDKFYRKNQNTNENSIDEYKKTSSWNQAEILKWLSELTPEQKYAVWIKNSNQAKELAKKWTKDPLWAIKENINADNLVLALIFWIIWSLFWGGKWFWIWAVLWFWIWAWGLAFAEEGLNKLWNKKEKSASWEASETEIKTRKNAIYEKIKFNDNSKKEELEELWLDLSKNDDFLKAPTSLLSIFETEKDEAKITWELKKYWIDLSEENKKYYKTIFAEILSQRKNEIWEAKKDETIKDYLNRTSKEENKKVAWVAWDVKKEEVKSERIDSELQKKELLKYFSINEKEVASLMKNLDLLWLNLFQLLAWYKIFIETKLSWIDNSVKEKIKHSIKLKTLLINSKIEELQKDDFYKKDFKNNRWIVNNEIKEIFEKINSIVLPSAYMLTKTSDNEEKIKRTKEMFNSNLTNDWDFDKTFLSKAWFGEFWDSSRNNWEVFNISNEIDLKNLDWIENDLAWLSLLNEKDKEIEDKAIMWYMAWIAALIWNDIASFTWVWTIPWAVIWWGYWITDAFKNEDLMISILKWSWVIPEEYRTNREWYDNVIAWIWAIPLLWWAIRWASKTVVITKYISKLTPEKLAEFNFMKGEAFEKITSFFKKWENGIKPIDINNYISKEVTIKDIRDIRKALKTDPSLNPQFIAEDWSIWTINKISWSNWKEIVEIGPLWWVTKETIDINQLVEKINSNINKWKNIQELEITRFLWKKESLIKSILPKKPWEEIKIWDKTIKKTIEWKFEYNWAKYDKADDIVPVLSRELKDSQIISKINEWWTKNLNKLFAWVDKKEIKIWDGTFRFRIEWENKILEIKNGTSWTTKSIDELSDWQAQILLDKILWSGIKEKIIWIAREKIENIKINNIISTTERDTLIKRFWKWAWEKISKEFDDFMTKIPSKSDGKSHIYWAERFKEKWFWNAIAWLLIWFKEWTWKTMLWWVVTNEIWETHQAWWISERYEKYDIYNDWIDTILNWILFKKVSLWRAIITQTIFENTLWNN